MLKLSQVRQYSRQVVSNPMQSVRRFLGRFNPSKLESSPAADTLIKVNPENYILGSNPLAIIQKIIAKESNAFGKEGMVFPIPDQPDFVLRVEKAAIERIANMSEEMRLIPIKHSENSLNHDNLGLPLYSVIGKSSPLYTKESLTPIEALAQKNNIMVLRRVYGNRPFSETFEALMDLSGVNSQSMLKYLDLEDFFAIRKAHNTEGGKKCLELLREGKNVIPKNALDPNGSDEYVFRDAASFLSDYEKYVETYLKELQEIVSMPEEAFKEAVDTILMPKDFLIDFQHTNNTFVDVKNKRFNFMDFEYDTTKQKYIYENPVREFRNVLLGKCFSGPWKKPAAFIVEDKDIEMYHKLYIELAKKINAVTPQEFHLKVPKQN